MCAGKTAVKFKVTCVHRHPSNKDMGQLLMQVLDVSTYQNKILDDTDAYRNLCGHRMKTRLD